MFSESSIMKEVNILNKVICYILVIIGLIILKDPVFLTFVDIFLLLMVKSDKKVFTINILITVFIF